MRDACMDTRFLCLLLGLQPAQVCSEQWKPVLARCLGGALGCTQQQTREPGDRRGLASIRLDLESGTLGFPLSSSSQGELSPGPQRWSSDGEKWDVQVPGWGVLGSRGRKMPLSKMGSRGWALNKACPPTRSHMVDGRVQLGYEARHAEGQQLLEAGGGSRAVRATCWHRWPAGAEGTTPVPKHCGSCRPRLGGSIEAALGSRAVLTGESWPGGAALDM